MRLLHVVIAASLCIAPRVATGQPQTFTISGRVVTSSGAAARNVSVMIGHLEGDRFSLTTSDLTDDGAFVASDLSAGRYVIYAGPSLGSSSPEAEAGYAVLTVRSNVDAFEIRTRPSHSVRGRVRFEVVDSTATRPNVSVVAIVAGDEPGLGMFPVHAAQVQPDGSFAIDNVAFSVVLRGSYQLPDDGSRWWAGPVLLEDRDITDIPTDFSKQSGEVEVVFTQRPTMVFGTVVEDATELPAEDAFVMIFAEEPTQRQPWATSSQVLTTDSNGRFWQTLLPGRYRAVAFPAGTFTTPGEAFRNLDAFAKLATPFTVDPERRGARVRLTVSRPPPLKR